MKNIDSLIAAHLNDEASVDEVRRLFEWIRAQPENTQEFARFALMHAQLRGQFGGGRRAHESGGFAIVADTSPSTNATSESVGAGASHARRRLSLMVMGSLAASLLVAVCFVLSRKHNDVPVAPPRQTNVAFATIAQTVNAEWSDEREFNKGLRVAAGPLDLRAGFVRVKLDSGVEVTLQGPARLELITPARVKLDSGLLTAMVPPGAEGFQVDTPNAEITDWGTAFGIHLDGDGVSRVSVFDGTVDIVLHGSPSKLSLKEGETARVVSAQEIETVDFDTTVYQKVWPISSGIERSTGAFRFAPPWPRRLRFVRSDDEIFVVQEGYVTKLTEMLKVNITNPGKYVRAEMLTPSELATGVEVRSFLLHFHPEHDGKRRRFKRTTGSITFDRPILGLIVLHKELAASAGRFPGRKAGESLEHRQLELTGNRVGDVITLSNDRRTVSLDLAAPIRFSDLVRVIVDAS